RAPPPATARPPARIHPERRRPFPRACRTYPAESARWRRSARSPPRRPSAAATPERRGVAASAAGTARAAAAPPRAPCRRTCRGADLRGSCRLPHGPQFGGDFPEPFQRPVCLAAHRAHADAEHLGHLALRQVLEVAQDEDGPLAAGQPG